MYSPRLISTANLRLVHSPCWRQYSWRLLPRLLSPLGQLPGRFIVLLKFLSMIVLRPFLLQSALVPSARTVSPAYPALAFLIQETSTIQVNNQFTMQLASLLNLASTAASYSSVL